MDFYMYNLLQVSYAYAILYTCKLCQLKMCRLNISVPYCTMYTIFLGQRSGFRSCKHIFKSSICIMSMLRQFHRLLIHQISWDLIMLSEQCTCMHCTKSLLKNMTKTDEVLLYTLWYVKMVLSIKLFIKCKTIRNCILKTGNLKQGFPSLWMSRVIFTVNVLFC